jgi:glutamate carboxypeptidase
MNHAHSAILDWIDAQADSMKTRLIEWANLNTGSTNLPGLDRFRAILRREFESMGAQVSEIELKPLESIDGRGEKIHTPLGKALSAIKNPPAPLRVFLCIHMDTVYPADHAFQTCTPIDANTLQGPGVADAKGGLLVMLTALRALERSPLANKIGWEVLINPDEEIGSLGSLPLLTAAAGRNRIGLLFEPAMPDGALVDQRKGSGNFSVVVRGRAAHAGRDFSAGRNAIVAAAALCVELNELNHHFAGITLNVGKIEGGGPCNVVPDLAVVRFNVRVSQPGDQERIVAEVERIVSRCNSREGISAELHGQFTSPPKIADAPSRALMDFIGRCGTELNLPIHWRSSGGVCDGNKLAAAGLPNVDTLGPVGGDLHSPREYVRLDSLAQRAKLTALALLQLAGGGESVLGGIRS